MDERDALREQANIDGLRDALLSTGKPVDASEYGLEGFVLPQIPRETILRHAGQHGAAKVPPAAERPPKTPQKRAESRV